MENFISFFLNTVLFLNSSWMIPVARTGDHYYSEMYEK